MAQNHLEFQFHGEGRAALAKELEELLSDNFVDWPHEAIEKTASPIGDQKSDPVAVAALILAVPGAVLATWDLAKRMQLKEKVDRLINWAKEKLTAAPETSMTIHLPNGIVVRLDQAKPELILDALSELATKEQGR